MNSQQAKASRLTHVIFEIAWKAILLVTPYIRVKRGCAGYKPIINLLPGGQYIAESQLCTAFQAGKDNDRFLSEGILSFVEYAPRLLIVQPSRLFVSLLLKNVTYRLQF